MFTKRFQDRELTALAIAFVLLLMASLHLTIPVKREVHTYLFIADITQSMNTVDMVMDRQKISRIAYSKQLMQKAIASMPCGSMVGIALFSGVVVSTMFTPIEVCQNFSAIHDAIDHIEWREAWHGNSRIGFGVLSAATGLTKLNKSTQVIFFTDGDEAPRLHAFNQADFSTWQNLNSWLLVGIGSDKPVPVPKYDENNKLIGYWSQDIYQLEPGIAQVSQETRGARDNTIATSDYDLYRSALDQKHLEELAKKIHGEYVRGDSVQKVLSSIHTQKPVKFEEAVQTVQIDISRFLAGTAGFIILLFAFSKNAISYWNKKPRSFAREGLEG